MSHARQLAKAWKKMQKLLIKKALIELKKIKKVHGFLPIAEVNKQLGFSFHYTSEEIELLLKILKLERKIRLSAENGVKILNKSK